MIYIYISSMKGHSWTTHRWIITKSKKVHLASLSSPTIRISLCCEQPRWEILLLYYLAATARHTDSPPDRTHLYSNQLIQHLFNDDTNVQQPWQTCMQECITMHIYTQTTTSSKELDRWFNIKHCSAVPATVHSFASRRCTTPEHRISGCSEH